VAVHKQRAVGVTNLPRETAVVCVIGKQVRVRLRVRQIVDRDDFERIAVTIQDRLQRLPTNASESVDPNPCGLDGTFLPSLMAETGAMTPIPTRAVAMNVVFSRSSTQGERPRWQL
jgi:hypothetical protein